MPSQVGRPLGGLQDPFKVLPMGILRVHPAQCQLGKPDDSSQHVVEVMGHSPGQSSDRLQLLRLVEPVFQPFPLQLGFLALGNVGDGSYVPGDLPLFVLFRSRLPHDPGDSAVGTEEPVVRVGPLPFLRGLLPSLDHPLPIVGVDSLQPAVAQSGGRRHTGDPTPHRVHVNGSTFRIGAEDADRRYIGQQPVTHLSLLYRGGGLMLGVAVPNDCQHDEAGDDRRHGKSRAYEPSGPGEGLARCQEHPDGQHRSHCQPTKHSAVDHGPSRGPAEQEG